MEEAMNQSQKKLKIIGSVSVGAIKNVRSLFAIMDSVTVIESKWHDSFKQDHPDMYPLDLSKMETWSTYSDCVSLTFKMINSKFIGCDVVVHNGDNLYGHVTDIRFTATLKIPYTFLSEIKNDIKWAFEYYCQGQYEDHLRNQKEEWVRKFSKDSLAEI
jgi:hypothetical protein